MKPHYFITGTDTDSGKTTVSCGLLRRAVRAGHHHCIGLKPIASGCFYEDGQLRNGDALQLQKAAGFTLPYEQVNPLTFEAPVAPHILLMRQQPETRLRDVISRFPSLAADQFTLVEGAGGWKVPFSQHELISGLVPAMQLKVIVVVGMKLGCISHALLTVESVLASGAELAGWVSNCAVPEMAYLDENLEYLQKTISAPHLGHVPFLSGNKVDYEVVADYLELPDFT